MPPPSSLLSAQAGAALSSRDRSTRSEQRDPPTPPIALWQPSQRTHEGTLHRRGKAVARVLRGGQVGDAQQMSTVCDRAAQRVRKTTLMKTCARVQSLRRTRRRTCSEAVARARAAERYGWRPGVRRTAPNQGTETRAMSGTTGMGWHGRRAPSDARPEGVDAANTCARSVIRRETLQMADAESGGRTEAGSDEHGRLVVRGRRRQHKVSRQAVDSIIARRFEWARGGSGSRRIGKISRGRSPRRRRWQRGPRKRLKARAHRMSAQRVWQNPGAAESTPGSACARARRSRQKGGSGGVDGDLVRAGQTRSACRGEVAGAVLTTSSREARAGGGQTLGERWETVRRAGRVEGADLDAVCGWLCRGFEASCLGSSPPM
ncbi:hypothetical protein VTO73DRAFT_10882 [Trametes versicolor]